MLAFFNRIPQNSLHLNLSTLPLSFHLPLGSISVCFCFILLWSLFVFCWLPIYELLASKPNWHGSLLASFYSIGLLILEAENLPTYSSIEVIIMFSHSTIRYLSCIFETFFCPVLGAVPNTHFWFINSTFWTRWIPNIFPGTTHIFSSGMLSGQHRIWIFHALSELNSFRLAPWLPQRSGR